MSRLHHPEVLVSHANARLNAHGRWLLVQRIRMLGRPGEARRGLRRGAS